MVWRRCVAVTVCAVVTAFGMGSTSGASTSKRGDLASANATDALAALGITTAQFEATSGGVSVAQLQEQLNALHRGRPIPNFARSPRRDGPVTLIATKRPPRQARISVGRGSLPPAPAHAHAAQVYICQAFGSNHFTPSIYSHGLTGYATLGFLQQCTNPRGTVSSSCLIRATASPPRHTNVGRNARGGINCSTDTVVGSNVRGAKGTMTANWGAYNKVGVPFFGLRGCVVDGASAFCAYTTTFRVGRNSRFGWAAG
jgi:hypothetical protein